MATVYDFSAAHLTDLPGAVGAMLYFGTPGRTKNAVPTQVAELLQRGFQVGGVFENNTQDWAQGRAGGQRFARGFDADVTRCGLPGLPGAFTADTPAADPGKFVDMLRGAGDVLGVGRVTAYGFMPQLVAAHSAGVASRFWLCGHCPTPMPPWVNLYQHNGSQPPEWGPATSTVGGITVDHNTVLIPDWGQHPAPTEADMPTLKFARTPDNVDVWAGDGITRRRLPPGTDVFYGTADLFGIPRDAVAFVADLDVLGDPLFDTVADDEAVIVDAIHAQPTGGQVDAAKLAAELAAVGGLLTMQQFVDILNKVGLHVEP